ncbi:MAG: hypothetical protein ABFD50_21180 [Smithella sp.]
MKYKLNQLKIGQKVIVQTWAEGDRIGVITELCEDVKNGYPGIEYEDNQGFSWWAYLDQVSKVLN